jgi:hypothetical protein
MGLPEFENKGQIEFPGLLEQLLLLGRAQFLEVAKKMILIEPPEERKRLSRMHGVIIGENPQDRKAREDKARRGREKPNRDGDPNSFYGDVDELINHGDKRKPGPG